jgi:dihydroorotate dehydrogenase
MYGLIRNMLFRLDAEDAHYFSMNMLKGLCGIAPIRILLNSIFRPNKNTASCTVFGLQFTNPVGLGAGFDKNAVYLRELETLGFGFVEIGTVTPLAQAGNEPPRLFRIPSDKALINRMGFNNDGVERIKARLEAWRKKGRSQMIIGGNIGKNKLTPNEEAWKDYLVCFEALFDLVDYFVVNVSSPNTPGLRELQEKDALLQILEKLQKNNQQRPRPKPLLLKIAPDLNREQLEDIAEIAHAVQLSGIVSSNTTISRAALSEEGKLKASEIGMGGLSGEPLKPLSNTILHQLVVLTEGKIPVIASGGIFTGKDATEKLNMGASLVQVWTGFIYEGPSIVKKICKQVSFESR